MKTKTLTLHFRKISSTYVILLALPVKTLLQCMSICKSWLSIISSDDFVKTHLSKSTNDPHFTHHHLFIDKCARTDYGRPTFKICSVYSLLNEPVTEPIEIASPKKKSWAYVVGYCNGLVCLHAYDDRAYLWNPSTRKSRRLPSLMMTILNSYYFCYDESDNDYKVFATCYSDHAYWQMFFYSSKSNCWRKIGDFPFNDIEYGVVHAKGCTFYWVVDLIMPNDYPKPSTIISLDIKTGTYQEVLQPKYAEGTYYAAFSTFGKSLSVCYNVKETRADFWVMNNYGAEESWIKLFTISYGPYGNGLPSDHLVEPLCICVNGDIMLSWKSQILLYKSKNNTFKVLFDIGSELHKVCTYVESLVSLNYKPELLDSNK